MKYEDTVTTHQAPKDFGKREAQAHFAGNSKMGPEWEYVRSREFERELSALRMLARTTQGPFYVVNLSAFRVKHEQWNMLLPRVEPFYAVKCNPNERLLSSLHSLGTGFDCASLGEMKLALAAGANPEQIIYANPCKQVDHLESARVLGVKLMTFDNHSELIKVARTYPAAELILRILVDDSHSICQMGQKYGASLDDVASLLETAKTLGLNVRGVSYHVGSGCCSVEAFHSAVVAARAAFDMGANQGFKFDILDIGGGFPGQFLPNDDTAGISFQAITDTLGPALDLYFPETSGVRLIAEPGRFYATASHTLATSMIGRREPSGMRINVKADTYELKLEPAPGFMYYINDGLYGSFNCVMYDHVNLSKTNHPFSLDNSWQVDGSTLVSRDVYPCSLWGPTCDGLDCVMEDANLPLLEEGDYVCFKDMGAYTFAAGSEFNGFKQPSQHVLPGIGRS
eukprot:CAMPEP_0170166926 /NCGR_PEP_ID=MMETSP0040_2-20121228/469_1 /TAXON_ID=641309 /ORGANISM="Lotharella oceanica, Strain CCMP622" /LENGTH=455 /DNA_ID=CAMNT_0010404781 /DNA_START=147 /DNA_END=1514 /DNA_ORIENTATION=-